MKQQIAFNEWFTLYIYVSKYKQEQFSDALIDENFEHKIFDKDNGDVKFEIEVHPMNCTKAYNIINKFVVL